ncbi:hypothetical protein RRG08_062201 [Elysia crispata]|uniref:Uncharacterized protein n=1 Tax=Elysia crispata TaxID=231223 RepID=A0AAE0Y9I9_9GAST|nr:hypothetical protein RRG08_062201 [Elysia crispata]
MWEGLDLFLTSQIRHDPDSGLESLPVTSSNLTHAPDSLITAEVCEIFLRLTLRNNVLAGLLRKTARFRERRAAARIKTARIVTLITAWARGSFVSCNVWDPLLPLKTI